MRSLILEGGLPSLSSLGPSIPFKLDPARPPPFILPLLGKTPTAWALSLKGLYSVSTEVVESIGSITFSQGFHQVIASNLLLSLGVKGRVPVFCLAQKPSLIGERLSRGKAVQLLSLSRLPREASLSLYLTGAENTTPLITTSKNAVDHGLSLEATCYLSIGENRLLLVASPIYLISMLYGRLGDRRRRPSSLS
uniref:Uncharacterized protein n=1 Tax=Ananas comosus var. bracteatus TaxID=296719 RepID=A0A6V7PYC5_ANACO|nr:unnamed protein product [Ananas comosus var. bracteatus]